VAARARKREARMSMNSCGGRAKAAASIGRRAQAFDRGYPKT
jgi:hypothetical protein